MASTAAPGFATGQVSVDTTTGGKLIVAARPGRKSLTLINGATTDVFVGQAGLTTSTGALLAGTKGQTLAVDTQDAVYGIVASASETVSYIETY